MTPADQHAEEIAARAPGQAHADDNAAWAAYADRHRSWSDGVEWWRSPATCYHKGLEDGIVMGREQAQKEMLDALRESLGAPAKVSLQDAIAAHLRSVDAIEYRRAWDAAARTDVRRAA